jgi:hypothetical protein
MASAALHIPDMLDAIREGAVPGSFNKDRTEFAFPTLAYLGARGATHLWTVRVRLLHTASGEYAPITDEMLAQPVPELPGYRAEITVEAQQRGGKVRDIVPTYVSAGKNLGKRNATNALTQALRDALGLYNKQRRRADIVEHRATPPRVSPRGPPSPRAPPVPAAPEGAPAGEEEGCAGTYDHMPPPMLVKKIGDGREATLTPADFQRGITAQKKYNGVHYVVFERPGPGGPALVRYSRTGTEYPGQEQIVAEMLPMYAHLPPIRPGEYGTPAAPATERDRCVLEAYGALPGQTSGPAPYFDGELYLHGKPLNWISGQARRGDDQGLLEYHTFDVFFPRAKAAGHDMESRYRQAYVAAVFAAADAAGVAHPHVVRVEGYPAHSLEELEAMARRFVHEGYEGAIARKDWAGYRFSYSNYHSSNLVKVKPRHDDEFPVVGFTQGTRGKDKGAVIWECEVPKPVDPNDRTFTVVPNMPLEDRKRLFECLSQTVTDSHGRRVSRFERDIKGLPLTVKYSELSAKTGKPLQPKALVFRTYEGGPQHDPVKKVLEECLD